MEKLTQKFNSKKWTFDYDMLAKGGLVLGNVKHDGYNLAKDIRVVRIWINPDAADVSTVRSFYLGTDDFDIIGSHSSYLRWTDFTAPAPFDIYAKRLTDGPAGVQARYRTRSKVFGNDADTEDDHLEIEQSFVFTEYGKDPPHEPGGILEAARLFPLIKFSYGGKKVNTIRIDYRFNASLDLFLDRDSLDVSLDPGILKLLQEENRKKVIKWLKDKRPMLAGIFRDKEVLPTGVQTKDLFFAGEKPVLLEVLGYGLEKGIPGKKLTPETIAISAGQGLVAEEIVNTVAKGDESTWDNIHMWANHRPPDANLYLKRQPSAPGAFHALHCHWRWPYYTGQPTLGDRTTVFIATFIETKHFHLSSLGADQFEGIDLKGHIGGPLLDAKIRTQTIRFGITEATPQCNKEPNKWDADQLPSTKVFTDLFLLCKAEEPPEPRDISGGENIITWLSIDVENKDEAGQPQERFEGTVFIHGMYFAHNAELSKSESPFSSTIGEELRGPKYDKPTWLRSPNGK